MLTRANDRWSKTKWSLPNSKPWSRPPLQLKKITTADWGERDRILNLPLMVAALLTLLWPDVAGVRELSRILGREGLLWCPPTQVSQQALSQRFLTFPAELFEKVFKELLPHLRQAWCSLSRRKEPESTQFARRCFEQIWIADSSTLEALFRKLKS